MNSPDPAGRDRAVSRLPVPLRYALVQLPELILVGIGLYAATAWELLATGTALLIVAGWVAKDVALYPLYRHALGDPPPMGSDALVGRTATVLVALAPRGQVRIDGERWQAATRDGSHVPAGATVRVVRAAGLSLMVEAERQTPCRSRDRG